MKRFIFDALIDEENFCNFKKERLLLNQYIQQQKNIVLYAPRNYGKTSLVKNLLFNDFKKKNKQSFFIYIDLIEVKSMEAIESRVIKAFEHYFTLSFPIKKIVDEVREYIGGLKPNFGLDALTGNLSIKLNSTASDQKIGIADIFQSIQKIAKKMPVLLVLDEFQDCAQITEAQGIFRGILESLNNTATIVLGSKHHLLSEIFANPNAPLAMWGIDLELKPIDYEEYQDYIQERFNHKNITLDLDSATYLQDKMLRIPEAINKVCQQILDDYSNCPITTNMINNSISKLLEKKQSRYENYLTHFSINEEKLIIYIAKSLFVNNPQGKNAIMNLQLTHKTIGSLIAKNIKSGVIEKTKEGYRIADPLLALYLQLYR